MRNERTDFIAANPLGPPTTSGSTGPASSASTTPPVVGDLELGYEAMELPANPGWTMFAYTAEPGSATEERLKLLASWAATSTSETSYPAAVD